MKQSLYLDKTYIILLILLILAGCNVEQPATNLCEVNLIPKPVSMTASGQTFVITEKTVIYVGEKSESALKAAQTFSDKLRDITGHSLKIVQKNKVPGKGIYIGITEDSELGDEGYAITIGEKLMSIKSQSYDGLIYGIQTLKQILPIEPTQNLSIATGTIRDYPYFSYRSIMLDVSRHFFQVDEVKRFIDHLAMFKINHLHLHLSDDQGWRIEIKSWPNLTAHGGSTEVGGGPGGYYTQEQYSELVKYAQERGITIVPEIDMPGHTNAALASYAELNCSGKATKLYTGTDVGFSTLCTKNEITYQFIDDVVREISALTPGPFFHIGGDESHVTKMEDYIPFVNRVQQIVAKYGKKAIGWDEIANTTLLPGTTAQFWSNHENGQKALAKGAKILMSPANKAYLDMQYDSTSRFGLHWAAYIEVETAYNWNPEQMLPGITKDQILGVEAPLWSETIANINEVEYLLFPRLPGYAEIGWTAPSNRNWEDYKIRLATYGRIFEKEGINYYKSPQIPW